MISDEALDRLRDAAGRPDLSGTRYELVERIGRGGMGAVYRVRDTALQREAALKVIDVPEASGAAATARLRREAAVLARLEHPGIVPVHDVGTLPDGRAFYVMKLVRGERLDAAAVRTRPLEDRVRVVRRVCDAVAFAHDRGVVHRDLKPSNVMIGPFGEVLVLDWGVARLTGAADPAPVAAPAEPGTAAGDVLGTPGYMAPEQARGEAASADARADVYGLGALLHDLVSGHPPRGAVDAPPGTPRALVSILRRCLADRPEDRYPGAAALGDDLDALLDRRPVSAHREGVLERVGRVLERHRVAVLLILAYMAMRVAVIFWTGR